MGIFVLLRNPRDARYFSFSAFCLTVAFWSFFYYLWESSTRLENALLYSRLLMAGAIFIPVAHLNYILILVKDKTHDKLLRYGYIGALVFLALDFTPYLVSGVSPKLYNQYWANPGPLFHPFLVVWMVYVLYAIFLIYKNLRRAAGAEKNRLTYVLLATLVGFGGGATNYFMWYNIPIPPYGNILVSVYVMIIAYAILKHHLMDIEVVFRKTAIYSILTALLTGILLSFAFLGEILFRGIVGYNSIWATILAIFTIALIFQPLRDKTQGLIDRLFFKRKYEFRDIIRSLSQTSASTLDLNRLIPLVVKTVSEVFRPERASVFLLEKDKDSFKPRTSLGSRSPVEKNDNPRV